jgi:hypothetical protein
MAWNDAGELIVGGNGQVYVAPVGTALPTTGPAQALNASFFGLGYHTEDGVSLAVTPQVTDFGAWQSRQPIRRELTAQEITVSFTLQQWNEETLQLAFGGGAVTDLGGGNYRYDFPEDSDQLDERSLVVDVADGSKDIRFVFPRGNITDAVSTQFQRSAAAVLPITFKVLEPEEGGSPGYFLTDSADFAAGS